MYNQLDLTAIFFDLLLSGSMTHQCKVGKISNPGKTACESPPWKTVADCDSTQYLNQSHPDINQHSCAQCPLGASCEGNVAWSGVRAKYGWWRVHAAEDALHPPACLVQAKDEVSTTPPCAFVKCLNPSACRGARNPALKEAPDYDLQEECMYDDGYKNNTCGEQDNQRCRLCGK